MSVLVTGGTGFLGSHLVHGLLEAGKEVVVLKRPSSDTWRLSDVLDDIRLYDIADMEKAFKDSCVDTVMHTACNYGRNKESSYEIVEANEVFPLQVFEYAIKYNVSCFINTDTFWPRNYDAYSMSKKHFLEWIFGVSQIQVINMKLEHMYGANDNKVKFIPWIIDQLKSNVPQIQLTEGMQERDFIFIDDVVSAFLIVLLNLNNLDKSCEFDVGTGVPITLRMFIEKVINLYQSKVPSSSTKLLFGAIPYKNNEIMKANVDNSKLKKLNWTPKISLDQGIKAIID